MNCKSTGAVARTWYGLTPSTALHNTDSVFPVVRPNTRLHSVPFSTSISLSLTMERKRKSEIVVHQTPSTANSATPLAFLFESTKVRPTGPASEQIKLPVL